MPFSSTIESSVALALLGIDGRLARPDFGRVSRQVGTAGDGPPVGFGTALRIHNGMKARWQ